MSRRPRAARPPAPQAPLDDPTDEDAFFSRPPKRKPRKPDPTDEELNDIFKAEPLDDELKDLFERAEKKR